MANKTLVLPEANKSIGSRFTMAYATAKPPVTTPKKLNVPEAITACMGFMDWV